LTMNESGLGAYAIPGYVYHRSLSTNMAQLRKYHLRLFWKHWRHYPRVFATSGGITWWNSFALPFIPPLVKINHVLFPNWIEVAKREVRGCQSILDLGCGYNSPVQFFDIPQSTGVEIYEAYLTESKRKAIHTDYVQGDIRKLEFPRKSYDAVFASEVLEHMSFIEGSALLGMMEWWAREKVIVTTPNGHLWQDAYDGNPFQAHQSAWTTQDFQRRGYRVQGMSGLKMIRGYKGQLTLRPEFLGMRVASLTHKVTRYVPQLDFQLLSIKDMR
jgi:SAM-dependent methyltransferase